MAAPVRVREIELRRVHLPLVLPFEAAHGTERERDLLLVRARTDAAEGWGECGALAAPTYTSEYVDGAHAVVRDHLAPRLLAAGPIRAEAVRPLLSPVKGHRMAKAAIETAILDAGLRSEGRSLADRLGAVADRVPCGVAVGIAASAEALLDEVGAYVSKGYRRVKLKIQPGWDRTPVAAVRERFGDDLILQADANGAYGVGDADSLRALDPYHLACLEQPLPDEQLLETAHLARRLETPICLDESIVSQATARDAIELGACRVVCLKPSRVGGYLEALRIHDLCRERGVGLWVGGMLESGLGRAGNLALAALPGCTLPGDLSGSDRYYARDLIREPLQVEHGTMAVPTGPGLGISVDTFFVEACTRTLERLAA
ncbi:MAG: o-succinylbenzoate synthase [Candidatus Dormibacteraeota bacterium]|nr:o-succinylbenzoate synthase [Candidatus Dormibacteraeota bacterium]